MIPNGTLQRVDRLRRAVKNGCTRRWTKQISIFVQTLLSDQIVDLDICGALNPQRSLINGRPSSDDGFDCEFLMFVSCQLSQRCNYEIRSSMSDHLIWREVTLYRNSDETLRADPQFVKIVRCQNQSQLSPICQNRVVSKTQGQNDPHFLSCLECTKGSNTSSISLR